MLGRIGTGRLAAAGTSLLILLLAFQHAAFGQSATAQMSSPLPGNVLSGSTVTFSWSAGTSATAYRLYLGTTAAGAANIYNSGSLTGTSVTVRGLPTNGVNLYATLFSEIGGVWEPASYTYTEAGTPVLAAMTSPVSGSTFAGTSQTFTWSAGGGPTGYLLYLGTLGAGTANLYSSGALTTTSVTVPSLPLTGVKVYATLFSKINGAWQPVNYTYTEALPPAPAAMIAPAAGSAMAGSSATFSWTAGSQVTAYSLSLGTTGVGSANLYNSGSISATSVTVSSLPTTGVTIYATLSSEIAGVWQQANYTYTEAPPILAAMTSPSPGTVLPGASVTFTWSAGAGPSSYWLYLGSTGPNSANLYNSGPIAGTSVAVSGLPTGGVNLYATLFSKINSTWEPVNYIYTEAGTTVLAAMSSPAPGSVLPGSSATFTWAAGNGPTAYLLYLGSIAPGTANLYSSGTLSGTSATVTGLPTKGATIYATLFSQINGAWQSVNYTYTESGVTGEATVSSLTCANSSITGAAADSCTVTLNGPAGSGGVDLSLASNNSAVTVPAIVTVPANSSSVGFSATVSAVTSAQTVTLTASGDNASTAFSLSLIAAIPTLSVNGTAFTFGDVVMKSPHVQSIVLTSSGTLPLTVTSATLTGPGFTMSGITYPLTLNPTQTARLYVEFNPTVTGPVTGQLTIVSNSSTGANFVMPITGTGLAITYEVDLSWEAVTGGTVPIAGYYVFRAPAGGGYTMITTTVDAATTYTDTTVASGVTYDYYLETVASSGTTSSPSSVFSISVP